MRNRKTSLLFRDSKGQHRNDWIALNKKWGRYGRAYHWAGRSLAQPFLKERGAFLDCDGLPVAYLYRHALELYLKGIILVGNRLMRQNGKGLSEEDALKVITKDAHLMSPLLSELANVCLWYENQDTAEDADDYKALGDIRFPNALIKTFDDLSKYIRDIDNVDPKGSALKYPIEKSKSSEPPLKDFAYSVDGRGVDSFSFSVNYFLEVMEPLVNLLGGFCSLLEECEEEWKRGES